MFNGDWRGLCSKGHLIIQSLITRSKSWVQEVLGVVDLGTIGIANIGWKEKGGMIGVDLGGTQGCLVRTRGVVGVGQVSRGVDGFVTTGLFG
jgi:hypothetical protein